MRKSFGTFLSGLCVGAADIVPGISGGTVAFIIGIYEELIESIASVNFSFLLKGQFRQFFQSVRWKFLVSFVLGAFFSFITLAKGFQYCLHDELLRAYLYASFLGLVVGSCFFVGKMISRYSFFTFLFFGIGLVTSYFLSGTDTLPRGSEAVSSDLWVIACGMMAVSAMLLPGISGSYILNIVGMYGPILSALIKWVDGIKAGFFDLQHFRTVACMGIGIVIGALLFSRVVKYLLAHYRVYTLSALVGFMVGALKCVWPFYLDGAAYLPNPASSLFLISLLFFSAGVLLVFMLEFLAARRGARAQ